MTHSEDDPGVCNGGPLNTFSVLDAPDERQNLVLAKTSPCETFSEFRIWCPQVALFCKPGQFVVVRGDERAERIPLTIADFDRDEGSITLIMQVVGVGTRRLDALEEGDRVLDVVGPNDMGYLYVPIGYAYRELLLRSISVCDTDWAIR